MNDALLRFDPAEEKVTRKATFHFPINFNGILINAYETPSGDYIIAEFEGEMKTKSGKEKVITPVINSRSVWAGLFIDAQISAPCFIQGLQLSTSKSAQKPVFAIP